MDDVTVSQIGEGAQVTSYYFHVLAQDGKVEAVSSECWCIRTCSQAQLMVHNLMNARKKWHSSSRKLWTVQLKTARSYPESRYHKNQVNLKQVYICSLQRSSQDFWRLIENLQLHWNIRGDDCESESVLWTSWSYLYCCCWQAVETSLQQSKFCVQRCESIACPTTTLFLITILAEVLWSWGNKYSPLGCLEHTLVSLLSLLNKIPWLENPILRFQPSSL